MKGPIFTRRETLRTAKSISSLVSRLTSLTAVPSFITTKSLERAKPFLANSSCRLLRRAFCSSRKELSLSSFKSNSFFAVKREIL